MAFDYKKEYKEFYLPKQTPQVIDIPAMNFIAVRGSGNPNEENGAYAHALKLLYGVAYTLKMSPKNGYEIKGYVPYVVPPLEGLWWQDGVDGIDYMHKETYQWISMIRLPDFVTKEDVNWAITWHSQKKKMDASAVAFFPYTEGRCVQCMHIGPYDEEPATVACMKQYASEEGYEIDITDFRRHHEIYLSDARRCKPENLKTVIRHPVKKR